MASGPLIALVGQTASGKSKMAMKLAEEYDGEIICADSRTIYKKMDIGTAKPSEEDRARIRHHLLDIVEPDERFNANKFKVLANDAADDIVSRGKVPFLVGGTGLYVSSLIYDFKFENGTDSKIRENCLMIGLKTSPLKLKARIKQRVDEMIENGLEDEVRALADKYGFDAPGMNSICYKEWEGFFKGEQSLDEVRQKLYTNNWQYARRQKIWFKRDHNIHWVTSVGQASVLAQQFLIQ